MCYFLSRSLVWGVPNSSSFRIEKAVSIYADLFGLAFLRESLQNKEPAHTTKREQNSIKQGEGEEKEEEDEEEEDER